MREVEVVGVRVEMPSNQPIVLLREAMGERYLPIWIGAVEATAIAFAQQGVVPPRPLTHDLLRDVLEATGNEVTEIRITEMKDDIFYAQLVLASGVEVSAPRTRSRWRCGPVPGSCVPTSCSTTRGSWCRTSRRTRSRSSASSSTTSRPRTSTRVRPEPQVEL
jgi:hypothetical protein